MSCRCCRPCHFSRVQLYVTPQMAAHHAPQSLGFSRKEHWSGLPFPSPMHDSEKWKWSRSVVSDSATPWTAAHQIPPSKGFSRQEYWNGVPLPSPAIAAMIHISFPSRTHTEEKPASVSSILLPIKENRAKELQRFTMSRRLLLAHSCVCSWMNSSHFLLVKQANRV